MWILPSRSRPQNLQRLFDAWVKTGASTPVVLCLDVDDPCWPQYEVMDMPAGWNVVLETRDGLARAYNEAFKRHPHEPWYGFIADDVVPLTNSWDAVLIDAAGKDGMAVPSGGHDPLGAPHFVLGGDLVRSVGWLSLPGLDRLYIDTVWQTIAESRGVLKRVPEVILEHRHFSNHKALIDKTYLKHHKQRDKFIFDQWRKEHGCLP